MNLEIKYPTASVIASYRFSNITEINSFVDSILQCVYDHAHTNSSQQTPASVTSSGRRQLIFSSFNPAICTAVNWKQPNCTCQALAFKLCSILIRLYVRAVADKWALILANMFVFAIFLHRCRLLQHILWLYQRHAEPWQEAENT